MLKSSLKNYILHLLYYIKTHVIQYFAIYSNGLMNIFTFLELSTSLHKLNHLL